MSNARLAVLPLSSYRPRFNSSFRDFKRVNVSRFLVVTFVTVIVNSAINRAVVAAAVATATAPPVTILPNYRYILSGRARFNNVVRLNSRAICYADN